MPLQDTITEEIVGLEAREDGYKRLIISWIGSNSSRFGFNDALNTSGH